MVVIRLSRGGAKARPFFNIVVADKRTRRDGNLASTRPSAIIRSARLGATRICGPD